MEMDKINKEEENPLVQYYVVNMDLNMSSGKIAAQCAHAAEMFAFKYCSYLPGEKELIDKWAKESRRKIILKGDSKVFQKLKEYNPCSIVTDAGLTEIEKGSETVMAFLPCFKSDANKLLKRMRIL